LLWAPKRKMYVYVSERANEPNANLARARAKTKRATKPILRPLLVPLRPGSSVDMPPTTATSRRTHCPLRRRRVSRSCSASGTIPRLPQGLYHD
jgi:hypothetical protein